MTFAHVYNEISENTQMYVCIILCNQCAKAIIIIIGLLFIVLCHVVVDFREQSCWRVKTFGYRGCWHADHNDSSSTVLRQRLARHVSDSLELGRWRHVRTLWRSATLRRHVRPKSDLSGKSTCRPTLAIQFCPQGQYWIEYLYLLLAAPPYYQYGRC